MVNLREIKDLIKLMNENDLTEIEVEFEGSKIKLKKGPDGVFVPTQMKMPAGQSSKPAAAEAAEAAPVIDASVQVIKSPMVGTFYSSPSPDAEPFLSIGSKVSVGQVVCIVEAMKLMNEIKSEIKGTVTEIHAKNGEPVEFGQPLFSVK